MVDLHIILNVPPEKKNYRLNKFIICHIVKWFHKNCNPLLMFITTTISIHDMTIHVQNLLFNPLVWLQKDKHVQSYNSFEHTLLPKIKNKLLSYNTADKKLS